MSTPQLQRLHEHCHRLRLFQVEQELTARLEQAAKRELSYADWRRGLRSVARPAAVAHRVRWRGWRRSVHRAVRRDWLGCACGLYRPGGRIHAGGKRGGSCGWVPRRYAWSHTNKTTRNIKHSMLNYMATICTASCLLKPRFPTSFRSSAGQNEQELRISHQ